MNIQPLILAVVLGVIVFLLRILLEKILTDFGKEKKYVVAYPQSGYALFISQGDVIQDVLISPTDQHLYIKEKGIIVWKRYFQNWDEPTKTHLLGSPYSEMTYDEIKNAMQKKLDSLFLYRIAKVRWMGFSSFSVEEFPLETRIVQEEQSDVKKTVKIVPSDPRKTESGTDKTLLPLSIPYAVKATDLEIQTKYKINAVLSGDFLCIYPMFTATYYKPIGKFTEKIEDHMLSGIRKYVSERDSFEDLITQASEDPNSKFQKTILKYVNGEFAKTTPQNTITNGDVQFTADRLITLTGYFMVAADLADLQLASDAMVTANENIELEKKNVLLQQQTTLVEKEKVKQAEQKKLQAIEENTGKIDLDEQFIKRVLEPATGMGAPALEVLKVRNLPAGLESYGEGGKSNPGSTVLIPGVTKPAAS